MVTPLALIAATPVGATTTNRFKDSAFIVCKKVVFPVPAFPVKKIDLSVLLTKSQANSSCMFLDIYHKYFIYRRFFLTILSKVIIRLFIAKKSKIVNQKSNHVSLFPNHVFLSIVRHFQQHLLLLKFPLNHSNG